MYFICNVTVDPEGRRRLLAREEVVVLNKKHKCRNNATSWTDAIPEWNAFQKPKERKIKWKARRNLLPLSFTDKV